MVPWSHGPMSNLGSRNGVCTSHTICVSSPAVSTRNQVWTPAGARKKMYDKARENFYSYTGCTSFVLTQYSGIEDRHDGIFVVAESL